MIGATITHDITVEKGASLGIDNSSVGHDVTGNGAALVEFIGYTGPISVGHDVTLKGTSPEAQAYGGYDICDTTVGHDLSITGVQLAYEIEVGDVGPQANEFCSFPTAMPTNRVGHDLAVSTNTASTSTGDTGDVGVDDNSVNHDATCKGNSPALSKDGPEDGPNHVGHKNDGCG